jgi:site-specific recombinase XerD
MARHKTASFSRSVLGSRAFLRWCEGRGIMRIEDVRPVHVAGYIEQLQATRKASTVKQHLACIRMLFDWLVTGQVIASTRRMPCVGHGTPSSRARPR